MDRGSSIQSSIVQQMVGGNPNWWNMDNMPYFHQAPSLLSSPSSSASSPLFTPSSQPSIFIPIPSWHENQEPPQSLSHLLRGGLLEEGERWSYNPCQAKKMEINWESDQVSYSQSGPHVTDVKHEATATGYAYEHGDEEIQACNSPWTASIPSTSSLSSCVTSFSSSMLNFSSTKVEKRHHKPDQTYECNSTRSGSASKKARVQASSTPTNFKVRKEKLGDRITALHQLVSPFGKTDTASVLLEAIGYIRFLQGQIEALSSPYLDTGLEHLRRCCTNGGVKDLRSRGLCLVPISHISRVGSENEVD